MVDTTHEGRDVSLWQILLQKSVETNCEA